MNIAAECLDNGKFSLWNLYSSNSNRLIFWHHQCKKNYQKGHLFKHCSTLLKASNVEKKSEKNHLSSKWRERKKTNIIFNYPFFFIAWFHGNKMNVIFRITKKNWWWWWWRRMHHAASATTTTTKRVGQQQQQRPWKFDSKKTVFDSSQMKMKKKKEKLTITYNDLHITDYYY